MAGLYIHIPFCASRCIYCGFYSTLHSELQDKYVDALCREMELRNDRPAISTIYLGGGTPSRLSHENLDKLFAYIYKMYRVDADAEITMECNPDDICDNMFRNLPVNRVSMGAQTFSDKRLQFLHRRHTAVEVDRAMALLHQQGIHNISIDLMFGFPDESMAEWQQDIRHVLELQPQHISAYGLMYEKGTPLYKLLLQNKVHEIDEELALDMYDMLIDRLTAERYEHYEFSNFALPGFRSRHNSSYWHNIPYIGLGAAAHSYNLKSRSWNIANIKEYIGAIGKGILPFEEEVLDEQTKYNDLITTALRTKEGIALSTLKPSYRDFLLHNAKPHLDRGFLLLEDNRIRFSRAGINISNAIMSDLMKV